MKSVVIALMVVFMAGCPLNCIAQSDTSLTISQIEANGDVDGNGVVNIADVMLMVNYLVGLPVGLFDQSQADLDHNEIITVADVIILVNVVVGNGSGDDIPLMESDQANPIFHV